MLILLLLAVFIDKTFYLQLKRSKFELKLKTLEFELISLITLYLSPLETLLQIICFELYI
jgi:hypothetical protein